MRFAVVERQDRLAERQPLKRWHADLNQEVSTRFEMRGCVPEAGELSVLRCQVVYRIENQVDE
jgi:hypothetical protein